MSGYEAFVNIAIDSGGYSRPNNFRAVITPPPMLELSNEELKRLSMNCSIAQLPGTSVNTYESDVGGRPMRRHATSLVFDQMSITFYLSADLLEKTIFDRWHRMIFDPIHNTSRYYDEYVGTLQIYELSRHSDPQIIAEFRMAEAWPTMIGSVAKDYSTMDTISTVDITMTYLKWERIQ